MSYQVLARKWRPRTFTEMVGQEHVLRALINALDNDRLHHAFLFTGTRGVGKTTIARILAKSVNCEQGVGSQPCGVCSTCCEIDEGRFVDLIEVDAASRTKVEDTRDLLDNVQYAPTRGRYKVYLIDEVHMLSNHSFNALLKTLEEPPPHVKFLLATTDPQKLPVTILSRCLQFNLRRLPLEQIQNHLTHLLQQEGIDAETAALHNLARAADGSMRDALSLLDQAIAFGGGKVSDSEVRAMLGSIEQTHIFDLLDALASGEGKTVIDTMGQLAEQAPDYVGVLAELLTTLHNLALLQQIPEAYDESMGDEQRLISLRESLTAEDLQLYYQIGITGRRDLPLAPDPRTGLEMVLLRMLAFRPVDMAVAPGSAPAMPTTKVPANTPSANSASTAAVESASTSTAAAPASANQSAGDDLKATTTVDMNDWHSISRALPLVGAVAQLAANSVLLEREANSIRLAVDETSAPLLTKEREAQMQKALSDFFGHAVKLQLEVQKVSAETPARRAQREVDEKQAAAEASIESDTNVKSLLEAFDGQVNQKSIQPVD